MAGGDTTARLATGQNQIMSFGDYTVGPSNVMSTVAEWCSWRLLCTNNNHGLAQLVTCLCRLSTRCYKTDSRRIKIPRQYARLESCHNGHGVWGGVFKSGAYTQYCGKHGACDAIDGGTDGTERGRIPRPRPLREYLGMEYVPHVPRPSNRRRVGRGGPRRRVSLAVRRPSGAPGLGEMMTKGPGKRGCVHVTRRLPLLVVFCSA